MRNTKESDKLEYKRKNAVKLLEQWIEILERDTQKINEGNNNEE
ncbi:MAG: hypothetical protein ACQEV7_11345 [Bacillota bacterium]